jgi:hypothetical protein
LAFLKIRIFLQKGLDGHPLICPSRLGSIRSALKAAEIHSPPQAVVRIR